MARAGTSAAAMKGAADAENDYNAASREVETLASAVCDSVNSVTQGNPDRVNNELMYMEEMIQSVDACSGTIKQMEEGMPECIVSSSSSSEDVVGDGSDSNFSESVHIESPGWE